VITVIAGGVGAARMLRAILQVVDASGVTAIVNVGDDLVLHGLHISPDIDTVTYTLASAINPDTGWGLVDESWQARSMLEMYGGESWFGLGDRDLGTHLYRTQRLADGADLATVTNEIAQAWGLDLRVLPVTCDRLRTMVTLAEDDSSDVPYPPLPSGSEISFQEYFVRRQHSLPISAVRFDGAASCSPSDGVLDSINNAQTIVIAPSNPLVSIAPILAVPGVRNALSANRERVVAVSPLIAGTALKGPADRMMVELGYDASVVGIAKLYREFASTLVIDTQDAKRQPDVESLGMNCIVTETIMNQPGVSESLARAVLRGGTQ
jgi:LPPG:FO 2-phospho-L-lactate transferase